MSKRIELYPGLFLDEYIPKDLYLKFENKPQILIGALDEKLLKADFLLRTCFGPVIINNWWNGGQFNERGLRNPFTTTGAAMSQHKFGRASDKSFTKATAEEVREYIKIHWKELGITCIEDEVSWVHSDVRYVLNQTELLIVPKT